MIQCLACEVGEESIKHFQIERMNITVQDWFHESCLNLRERPPSREPSPAAEAPLTNQAPEGTNGTEDNDDAASEASSSGLPPPRIQGADYESFVCGSCVSGIHTLKRYAGTPGVLMVVRDDPSAPWRVIGDASVALVENLVDVSDEAGATSAGTKRPRSSSTTDTNSPEAKRARASPNPATSSVPCLAPSLNITADAIFTSREKNGLSLGAGDVFLTEGWRDRWCHCVSVSLTIPFVVTCCLNIRLRKCHPSLESKPFLLHEEETYEPPEDPDSGLSLEELGMRALQRLPRDRAIDGIHAFNNMRYVPNLAIISDPTVASLLSQY